MYVSGADEQGSYGNQIWVSLDLPFSMTNSVTVSPRLMYVEGALGKSRSPVASISAHAPHNAAPAEVADEFWASLTCLVYDVS